MYDKLTANFEQDGWKAELKELSSGNYSELRPGDILLRREHVGLYVGDGKQVDQGGPGGSNSEVDPSWTGPLYRAVSASYTHYVRFTKAGNLPGNIPVGTAKLGAKVQAYRPKVEIAAAKYGMSGHVNLLLALMMQESAGNYVDVMQASEGAFNTRYPKTPNGITDVDYSIECGVQELKAALELTSYDIALALQCYNFGPGFYNYAKQRGGYSPETAQAFSDEMKVKMGWSGYGDPKYVEHVLRYYHP
ncbi:hypothetical protein D3C73_1154340 [compost metagenome]